jgi:hypothetical protein
VTPLYLYAIIDERPRQALGNGITRRPLSVVRAGKAYVVIERAEAREATAATLVAHDRVVRRIARASAAVLPLRFASTAPDRTALDALLEPLAAPLEHAFERVRGAVQFTLRVSGRRARPPSAERRAGPGTRWLAKRIAAHRAPEIEAVTEATRSFVREARCERHDRPPLLASVYHLVARKDVRAWRAALARAVPLLDGVRITTTGPWPPYAFAELA